VDLDPVPGVPWSALPTVAMVVQDVLTDFGLVGWPKTSGSRGFHVFCRIAPQWTFTEVRKAAYALAREVERRVPDLATAQWWKEERHGVFVDYNQNAKDHTTAAQYSVRATPDGRVSMPLYWDEVPDCDPAAYTLATAPVRFAELGDASVGMDEAVGSLVPLLELAASEKLKPPPARPPAAGQTAAGQTAAGQTAAGQTAAPTGRRRSSMPLIEIARAKSKEEAFDGLDRWKARHPDVWPYLEPPDILVDSMRGRSSTWTRIRLNLQHVPEDQRPAQEPLEVDFDPWQGMTPPNAARGR
jgi:hypothetical protein